MVVHYALTQMPVKAGINKFGQKGIYASKEEMQQLHAMSTFTPVKPKDMIQTEIVECLESLMFLN